MLYSFALLVEGHCSGPNVSRSPRSYEMDKVQNWGCMFCERQREEVVLHKVTGNDEGDER